MTRSPITFVLSIISPLENNKVDFAVCVRGMIFSNDESLRLVEWLELLFLFGADKVFFYEMAVHPNISKAFKHHQSRGQIDVKRFSLPGEEPNILGLLEGFFGNHPHFESGRDNIPYNNCLYRNIERYKFLAVLALRRFSCQNGRTTGESSLRV